MSRHLLPFAASALLAFSATSVAAQATRTWVSGVGDDVNPCSRTAPCKTFAGAISKTAAGGEISVLDPGGYGGITINKSITINGEGTLASILVSGANGVLVNAAPTDVVTLRNLSIQGIGSGLNGVRFINGAALHIENVSIQGFRGGGVGWGIAFQPAGAAELHVTDTTLTENGAGPGTANGGGVLVQPSGAGVASATLVRVNAFNNNQGYRATTAGAAAGSSITMALIDSVSAGNTVGGVGGIDAGTPVDIMISGGLFINNGSGAINGSGALTNIRVGGATITGNGTAFQSFLGAAISSYRTNQIDGNGSIGLVPTQIPLQ